MVSESPPNTWHIRIAPTTGWRWLDLRELWHYRELIYFLTWRDIKVRYKQTAIGIGWALLQPVAMMAVFMGAANTSGAAVINESPPWLTSPPMSS